jgi:hypothetical protein
MACVVVYGVWCVCGGNLWSRSTQPGFYDAVRFFAAEVVAVCADTGLLSVRYLDEGRKGDTDISARIFLWIMTP